MAKNNPTKLWLLTFEANDYDQHGEYFCAIFFAKPSAYQMVEHLGGTFSHEQLIKNALQLVETGSTENCSERVRKQFYLKEVTPQ